MTKNKSKILGVLVIVILLAVGLKIFFIKSEFHYVGTVEATQVDVSSRLATVIANVNVNEGQNVEKGMPLLQLSCEDQTIAAELASENFKRAARLFKVGSMPQESYDQANFRKKDADLKMEWCKVSAPLSGTVLTRYHEPGEWVAPGTRLLTLADLREVWAYIYVPLDVLPDLKTNMKVRAILPEGRQGAYPALEGTIIKINDQAEFTPKNVQTLEERTRLVYGVKVLFSNPVQLLRPGMSVEIKLPARE